VVRAQRRTYAPGGAANVVANIQSLGGRAIALGVVGDDGAGRQLISELESRGADVSGIVVEPKRCTTLKTRIMAHRQQIARVDHEVNTPIAETSVRELLRRVQNLLEDCSAMVVSDYGKGVLRRSLLSKVIEQSGQKGKHVVAGPKPDSLSRFAGATLLSFNRTEAAHAAQIRTLTDDRIDEAGATLLKTLDVQALAITLGGDGVALFVRGAKPRRIPAHAVDVFDVAGAGDTFLAGTALAMAAQRRRKVTADLLAQAIRFGNLAAAAAVRKVGVVAVTPHDIELIMHESQ
jgi:D-beta-D-heptose 7-phosphate kinase/D-beta-D-heptose 1-phosphate adenosyltransferase